MGTPASFSIPSIGIQFLQVGAVIPILQVRKRKISLAKEIPFPRGLYTHLVTE